MSKPSSTTKTELLPAVAVRDLTVRFDDTVIIDGISFEVPQGSVTAVIGPNGSGKTTLIKAILDLLPTTGGETLIFGKRFHGVRPLIGYVPQRFEFDRNFPITVWEFLDLARRLRCPRHYGPEKIEEKIEEVGLPKSVLTQQLGQLSGGQLQRVLIAQAILNDPPLLILDEPAANIDVAGERTLYGIIEHLNREHHTTVIMITHDIGMIHRVVDAVICINRRLMCYGSPHSALTEARLHEIFGHDHGLYEHAAHDVPAPRRRKNR